MNGTLAQILFFGGNFAPRNWAFCNGQILSISENDALFALLGTTYGGNGQTTFALPDFRGRAPMGTGLGPGLASVMLGQVSGSETVTLTTAQMPAHTHVAATTIAATHTNAVSTNPAGNIFAVTNANTYNNAPNSTASGASVSLGNSGGSQPFSIRNPYLAVNFVICLFGIFPSRN
jgi:microcystin-dependent protein